MLPHSTNSLSFLSPLPINSFRRCHCVQNRKRHRTSIAPRPIQACQSQSQAKDLWARVKQAIPLSQAFVDYAYCHEADLKSTAASKFKLVCPFHDDHNPSLHIDDNRAIFRCFACGAAGSIIDLQMRRSGNQSVGQALTALAQKYPPIAGILEITPSQYPNQKRAEGDASQDVFTDKQRVTPAKPAIPRKIIITHKEIGQEVLRHTTNLYQRALYDKSFRPALQYLMKQRGLSMPTIRAYGCGYAPPNRTADFAIGYLASLDIPPEHAVIAGIARESEDNVLLDIMRDRIVTPIKDDNGTVISLAGRVLSDANPKAPKYINGPETALFKKSNILFGADLAKNAPTTKADFGYVVVVEGYMDVMMMFECTQGRVGCVATMGTAMSTTQIHKAYDMLKDRADGKIIINFDGDAAGFAAVERMCENIIPRCENPHAVYISFPPYSVKDPDEFLSLTRRADDYVAYLQKTSQPWYEWHGKQIVRREVKRMNDLEKELGNELNDEELTASPEALKLIESGDANFDFRFGNVVDRLRDDMVVAYGAPNDFTRYARSKKKKRARVSEEALDKLAEIVSRTSECLPSLNGAAVVQAFSDTLSRGEPELMRIIYANIIQRIDVLTKPWHHLSGPVQTHWMGIPPWLVKEMPRKKRQALEKGEVYDQQGRAFSDREAMDPAFRKRRLNKVKFQRTHVIPELEKRKGERVKRLRAAPRRSAEEVVLQTLIFSEELERLDCLQCLLDIMVRFEERSLPFWTSAEREALFDYLARVEGPTAPEEMAAYCEGVDWWTDEIEELFRPASKEPDTHWRSVRGWLEKRPIETIKMVGAGIEEMAGLVQSVIALEDSRGNMAQLGDAAKRSSEEEARLLLARQLSKASEIDRTKFMSPYALETRKKEFAEEQAKRDSKTKLDNLIKKVLDSPGYE